MFLSKTFCDIQSTNAGCWSVVVGDTCVLVVYCLISSVLAVVRLTDYPFAGISFDLVSLSSNGAVGGGGSASVDIYIWLYI